MIDPLTAASAFATVVGLIGQYRSERSGSKSADFEDFQLWLESNNHQKVLDSLDGNLNAINGIKELIQEDKDTILKRLESLNDALAGFASNIQGFAQIAEAINPEAVLSSQAVSILKQFESNGSSKILEAHSMGGMSFMFLDGNRGELNFDEDQFIEDDLATLCELGLLRQDYNSQGRTMFRYTRRASKLVQKISGS